MDTLTPAQRSERMSRVRATDTKPEMTVRRLVHGNLPGRPDLVFSARGKIIFVHGCFWHRHGTCKNTRWPKSRLDFWKPKLETNRARDLATQRVLRRLGWKVLVVWECQLKNLDKTAEKIKRFLENET